MDTEEIYHLGAVITGILTFIPTWIYCIYKYGFLLGVGLGWLPSMIVAFIAALIWPVILILIMLCIIFILYVIFK